MRISDWSSDVCSSDLTVAADLVAGERGLVHDGDAPPGARQRDRRSRTRRSTTDDGDVAGVRRRHQQKIPAPGRYVARKVSCSVWPSGKVRVRVVVTTLQLPDWLSLRSVCSAVAWGDAYSVTVRLDRKSTRLHSSHYCD